VSAAEDGIFLLLNDRVHQNIHDYVNDGMTVSIWQDGGVTESHAATSEAGPLSVRTISEVDELRALADPTRLALLSALMDLRNGELPIMSVKELAGRLGEPQTKLYRHIKQLEAVGLVKVAATRMVSGILEQRYQASQRDFDIAGGLLRRHAPESEAVLHAMISNFRDDLIVAMRAESLAPEAADPAPEYLRPKLFAFEARVTPEQAEQIRARLGEITQEIAAADSHGSPPGSVPVSVFIGYYSPPEPDES
jgi:DNA-binding transcriptional ArsR family regulator